MVPLLANNANVDGALDSAKKNSAQEAIDLLLSYENGTLWNKEK